MPYRRTLPYRRMPWIGVPLYITKEIELEVPVAQVLKPSSFHNHGLSVDYVIIYELVPIYIQLY